MELEIFYPNAITLEMIICYVSQALVSQTALIVEQRIDMILLAIHSDFVKITQEKGRNSWPLVCGGRECATEHDNGAEPVDDLGQEQSNSVDGNGYVEDQMNDGGDWNPEEGGDGEGGSDDGTGSSDGGEDEEDDEEGYWLSDDDDEECDEDEEEEDESSVDRHAKKQKYWAPYSDEETDSESDDETDEDEPGYGSLLKHAREVYKPTSLPIFEHEYTKSRMLSVLADKEDCDRKGLVFEYDVQKIGHHFDYRKLRVSARPLDGIIECDCKYFDVAGILCRHALTVLGCLRIENIPEQYILERHTKVKSCITTENRKRKGSSSPDRNHQSRSIKASGACKEVAECGNDMRSTNAKEDEGNNEETGLESDQSLIDCGSAKTRSFLL